MDQVVNDLLASIYAKPLPAGPVRLSSGEMAVDLPKLLKTTSGYLAGTTKGSPAYEMYVSRLRLLKQRVDEIRELEPDAGRVSG